MAFLELDKSCLLKADEFPGSKSAFIRDENGKLIAKQTILKYLPTQAYCIYSDCSDAVAGKNIRVKEEDDDVHQLKLVSIDNPQFLFSNISCSQQFQHDSAEIIDQNVKC
ncbi:unnamed protein product [Cylicostephanus goldi]|uniref:DUF7596 domain-containing protein n=1 Tax=Cylicostephanus goldi TaxID=71465 RepID=A0A3P7LW87_CYLGO|nr:unnamed protein product [Cylicostephanus goldi]